MARYIPDLILGSAILGDVTIPDWSPLFNIGAVGVVLAWQLFRTDRRLDYIEDAIDRINRVRLIEIMAGRSETDPVHREAQRMLEEIDVPTSVGKKRR